MRLRVSGLNKLALAFVLATLIPTRISIGLEPRPSTRVVEHDQAVNTESRLKVSLSWGHKSAPGTRLPDQAIDRGGSGGGSGG